MSDTNPATAELRTIFAVIPAMVTTTKDIPIADELISSVSRLLGAGPASRPAVHPRPANAGLQWDNLDIDAQVKFDAVVDLLSSDTPHVQLDDDQLQEAARMVHSGLERLSELIQQPTSGTVQRRG